MKPSPPVTRHRRPVERVDAAWGSRAPVSVGGGSDRCTTVRTIRTSPSHAARQPAPVSRSVAVGRRLAQLDVVAALDACRGTPPRRPPAGAPASRRRSSSSTRLEVARVVHVVEHVEVARAQRPRAGVDVGGPAAGGAAAGRARERPVAAVAVHVEEPSSSGSGRPPVLVDVAPRSPPTSIAPRRRRTRSVRRSAQPATGAAAERRELDVVVEARQVADTRATRRRSTHGRSSAPALVRRRRWRRPGGTGRARRGAVAPDAVDVTEVDVRREARPAADRSTAPRPGPSAGHGHRHSAVRRAGEAGCHGIHAAHRRHARSLARPRVAALSRVLDRLGRVPCGATGGSSSAWVIARRGDRRRSPSAARRQDDRQLQDPGRRVADRARPARSRGSRPQSGGSAHRSCSTRRAARSRTRTFEPAIEESVSQPREAPPASTRDRPVGSPRPTTATRDRRGAVHGDGPRARRAGLRRPRGRDRAGRRRPGSRSRSAVALIDYADRPPTSSTSDLDRPRSPPSSSCCSRSGRVVAVGLPIVTALFGLVVGISAHHASSPRSPTSARSRPCSAR